MNNKRLPIAAYYTLSFTWGIVMTLVGLLMSFALLIAGKKPERNQYGIAFKVGKSWGGFSAGPFAVVCEDTTQHTLNHEFGHSIQNCYYGPLMIFVTIASVCRYHYFQWNRKHRPNKKLPEYDAIWFEGEASELGSFYKDGK